MQDYAPLDISAFRNVPWEKATKLPPPGAAELMQGLPFALGGSLLGFHVDGSGCEPVRIAVGSAATYIIFAHALLDITPFESAPGKAAAHYRFHFAGGGDVRVPIRERMEIGVPRCTKPFLALPAEDGRRWTNLFTLWRWKNPRPGDAIEAVTIEPLGYPLVIGGITLSCLEEEPFTREARVPVKVVLPQEEDARRGFGLSVEIDRGMVTPAAALPPSALGPRVGWGEPPNKGNSPAFVEVAGNPSATLRVHSHGQELGQVNWGALQAAGQVETPRVHLSIAESGRNWVHVTVLDDETNRPVPCRIHFRSEAGIPYQPHGHHNQLVDDTRGGMAGDLRMGQAIYAYIDGRCQGWLPRGRVIVDAAKGFEYEPLREIVEMKPGQRELTLRLKRWTNMNQKGWYSGDSHVHFLSTFGAHREAQGEGLNVVNLLQTQFGEMFANSVDFKGGPFTTEDGNTIVYCSQENRQHILGHISLLGLKQPVMPWCTDGEREAERGGPLEVTMSHWADACHAQGGTVVLPHFPHPNGEPAALVATGRVDAVEMLQFHPALHGTYYRYLNCGYRLPLVGGTDKMTRNVAVGLYRTYAEILKDEPFDYDRWCAAVRAGRTFLSSGPMIRFTVNGAAIGDTLRLPGNGGTLEVEAVAESIFPMHTLQVVRAGEVVAQVEDAAGARRLHLKEKLKVDRHTWLATRCGGKGYFDAAHHHIDGNDTGRGIFAHTSPIYVAVGEDWWMFDPETAHYMLTLIEGSCQYVRQTARHHKPGTVTHHHGQDDHLHYLEEPFHEAAAAIHRRLHQLGIAH